MAHEDDPPPRGVEGGYNCKKYGEWLRRRAVAGLGVTNDGDIYDFQAERARLTHHQANKTRLEEYALNGKLIPAAQVEEEWLNRAMAMRAKLLSLPSKLATVAMSATSLREVKDFAATEIYAALDELAIDIDERSYTEHNAQAGAGSEAAAPAIS